MMNLIDYYSNRERSVQRETYKELHDKRVAIETKEAVQDACEFLTGKNDFDQVRGALKKRFATVIAKDDSGYQYWESSLRGDEAAKFDGGHYPVIVTGVSQTICNTIACLFTSPEQTWKFMVKDSPSEDIETMIDIHRSAGSFDVAMTAADYIASFVDSGIVHVFPKGENLSYECVWPSSVHVLFGEQISETLADGRVITRPVDHTDIEDAWAVVIEKGEANEQERNSEPDKNVYTAYCGSNGDWELGRMVTYKQSSYWPIPMPGDDCITSEYTHDTDGICNPMTHVSVKDKSGIGGGYEYPITVIKGDRGFGATRAIPTSLTTYQCCVEIELLWSHLLHNADKAASGIKVLNLGQGSMDLPKSLDIVVLKDGQTFNLLSPPAPGVQVGCDTLVTGTRALGSSRGVPSYQVIGAAPSAVESGIALAIKTQPLISGRNRRIEMNNGAVEKIFSIEQSLLTEINPAFSAFFTGSKAVWNAGSWIPPKDQSTMVDDLIRLRDGGMIDHYETLRRANGLPTIEDAINLDEEYAERDNGYESAAIVPGEELPPDGVEEIPVVNEVEEDTEEVPVVK